MKWAKHMNRNLTDEDIDMANMHMIKCSASRASGIYKSKLQWDTTPHQWEWGKLRRLETTNVGEDAEKRETSTLLVGMWTGAATLENCVDVPQRVKNRPALRPSNCTVGDLPQISRWNERSGHLHPDVFSRNVHNKETVDGAMVSIERWMDKEDVVYVYNGILLSY